MKNEALEHLISLVDVATEITKGVPGTKEWEHFEIEVVRANDFLLRQTKPLKLNFTLPLT